MQHCLGLLVGKALCVALFGLVQIIVEIESTCPSPYYPPTHTACLDPSPYSTNPKGVTPTEQATIVGEHNKYRSSVVAADMQKVYWDVDLAFVAEKLAENCSFAHDSEREILCKYSAGQNIAIGYSNWAEVVQAWYNETYKFTYGSSENIFSEIGHYTQLMWSTTTRVGCGSSFCTNYNQQIYVCNYAQPGNIQQLIATPYTAGEKCLTCPNHCNKNGLCDCGGLVCKNDGILNPSTCTCDCTPPYDGSLDCNLNCSGVTDDVYCNSPDPNGFPPEICSVYSFVPQACPIMCGVCPGSICLELQSSFLGDQTTSSDAIGTATPAAPTTSASITPAATTAALNPIPITTTAENNPASTGSTTANNPSPTDKPCLKRRR